MAPETMKSRRSKRKRARLPPTRDLVRLIEEYANDLRKVLEKLRKRLH
jgi:hypothetical protein